MLITGGAGFLGVNANLHFIEDRWHVTLLDNLSRPGTERNLKWLLTRHPSEATFIKEDVRNAGALAEHVKNQDASRSHPEHHLSDIGKAKKDLGWEPKIPFDRGLNDLIQWAASLR